MRLPKDIQAAAQELIALESKLAPFRADFKRREELRKELQQYCDLSDKAMPVTLQVPTGSVTFSACPAKVEPAPTPQVVAVLGQRLALLLCTFNVTTLRENLEPRVFAQVVIEGTGSRSLKAVIPR